MVAQQRAKFVCKDSDVSPLLEFAYIIRVLEAETAETHLFIVNPVPIEMENMIWLTRVAGPFKLLTQGRHCGRTKDVEFYQARKRFHRFDQRQRAGTVID